MKRLLKALRAAWDLTRLKAKHAYAPDPGGFSTKSPHILVFGYMGFGDLLMLAPSLQALKERWPSARLTLLTGPYSAAASIASLIPAIDQVLEMDWKSASSDKKEQFAFELKRQNFDALIATYTAPVRFFMPLLAHVPVRAGALRDIPFPKPLAHPLQAIRWWVRMEFFEEEFFKRHFFNRSIRVDQSGEHEREKNRRLVELILGPVQKLPPLSLRTNGTSPSLSLEIERATEQGRKRLVVIHPSVSPGQWWKAWPIEKYGKLMELLLESKELTLVLVGTKEEGETVAPVVSRFPRERVVNLMGLTKVPEMASLLKKAALFVGGDSGPGHLAIGLGTPAVRIFGPSDLWGYSAWGSGPAHDVTFDISCRPCLISGVERPGRLNFKNCPHLDCLNKLEPETVLRLCWDLLKR